MKKPFIQQIDYKLYFRDEWVLLQEIKSTLLGLKVNPDTNLSKLVSLELASDNIINAINKLEEYREERLAQKLAQS